MKADRLFHHLREVAEKLGIHVVEKSFRNVGVPVKSGLCRVRNRTLFILDRNIPLADKNMIMADVLSRLPHETVFVVPEIRKYLTTPSSGTSE